MGAGAHEMRTAVPSASNHDMTSTQRMDQICSILSVGVMRLIHANTVANTTTPNAAAIIDDQEHPTPAKI
jgi:hypothetical protein